jgi:hypothetical protein
MIKRGEAAIVCVDVGLSVLKCCCDTVHLDDTRNSVPFGDVSIQNTVPSKTKTPSYKCVHFLTHIFA